MWLFVQISINTSLYLYPTCIYVNSLKYSIKPNRLIKNICFHLFIGNLNHMADANLIKPPFWAAILKLPLKFNSLLWLLEEQHNLTSCGLQKHKGLEEAMTMGWPWTHSRSALEFLQLYSIVNKLQLVCDVIHLLQAM